jgi:hypothetical protein
MHDTTNMNRGPTIDTPEEREMALAVKRTSYRIEML